MDENLTPDVDENVDPTSAAAPPSSTDADDVTEALLRERAGYEARGLHDRVAQVNEQLKARGRASTKIPASGPRTTADSTPRVHRNRGRK
ncbi:MAG: hypothetical protein KF861_00465 [Planctomycetaceae bacterium]|nr:hypothetical protein [Planctomycetaceae bacterium]